MELTIRVLIGLITFIHLYIMWMEMFAWEKRGKKVFKSFPEDLFPRTKLMASHQGLYNGFLAAGLLWTFFIQEVKWQNNVSLFFLICVFIAGIYATLTIDKKVFFVQALPALVSIVLILI